MPSRLAFDWRPGPLEWLLVVELIVLLTMALYRYIAALLGRSAPTDPLVIFYHVFWRAMRTPKRYPVPVNYLPVPPKRPKPKLDEDIDTSGLTDEEIEALMLGGELDPENAGARGVGGGGGGGGGPAGEDQIFGGTRQATLDVTLVPADVAGILAVRDGRVTIGVDVPPDDGRANQMAIRQVCNLLRLAPHQVSILSGHARVDKTLRVSGLSPSEMAERLESQGAGAAPAPGRYSPQSPDDSGETLGFRGGWQDE